MKMKGPPAGRIVLAGLLAVTAGLAGCHDMLDLDRMMVVTNIGIDAAPDGRYRVILGIPIVHSVLAGAETGEKSEFRVTEGPGLFPAISSAQKREEHSLFFGHTRAIVYGEALARKGFGSTMDLLSRPPWPPPNAYIVVARPDAEQVVKVRWTERIHDQNISYFMENKEVPVNPVKLWTFFRAVPDPLEDPLLPVVEPGDNHTALRLAGLAVIKGDKMVGLLNQEESDLAGLAMNGPKSTRLTIPNGPGEVATSIWLVHGRTSIKGRWRAGRPIFSIQSNLHGYLVETNQQGILRQRDVRRIEQKARARVAGQLLALFEKVRDLGSDPFQFGNHLRIDEPRCFSLPGWPGQYRRTRFEVEVDFRLKRLGILH